MPRVKQFDQDQAIRKAMELFWQNGYVSTSLTDLTDFLGIGKGSFYAAFQSKENLFNKCIEAYTASSIPELNRALSAHPNFKTGLRILLEEYVEGMITDSNRKGCLIANSCTLVNCGHPDVEEKIKNHYDHIQQFLKLKMLENGATKKRAEEVSYMIITFIIGVSQQSKIYRDREVYQVTIDSIMGSLD